MEPSEQLDRIAGSGDPEAKFHLARQLMSGAEAPQQIQHWISLVEESSEAGHAAATELWAVFEAMGVARPQNWDRAFDRLQLAAEQGSASAQRQLLILAQRESPEKPADGGYWGEVRARISLSRLLAHKQRGSLSNSPRIRAIEGFASPRECTWLIDRARSRLKPATVIDLSGKNSPDPGRSNTGAEFLVQDMDIVLEIIRHRISSATRIPVPVFEHSQILHYSVGQEFKPHYDYFDPSNPNYTGQLSQGQRIATFLIYLNDEFEGGETQFPDIGLQFRAKAGDAIFWANVDMEGRPDALTRHAGLAPTSGEKWVFSQWIRDRVAGQR